MYVIVLYDDAHAQMKDQFPSKTWSRRHVSLSLSTSIFSADITLATILSTPSHSTPDEQAGTCTRVQRFAWLRVRRGIARKLARSRHSTPLFREHTQRARLREEA